MDFNVLAIAPVSKGLGFVFMRDRNTLVDWGTKTVVKKDKNKKSLAKVEKLIKRFQPDVLVLPENSRQRERIRKLVKSTMLLGQRHGLQMRLVSNQKLRNCFSDDEIGSKHSRATIIANRFQEQIGDLLPPERQTWMSENHFMPMFDAAALALAHFAAEDN